jgi:hypothetical protein
VLIDRKNTAGKRQVPCGIYRNPAIIDPDTAGQMVRDREAGCQMAEFWWTEKVRILPQERDRSIDHPVPKPAIQLRREILFRPAVPLPGQVALLRCSI